MKAPHFGPIQRLLCVVGWHRREARTRRREGYDVTAECRGCRRPMVHRNNGWRLDRDNIRAEHAGRD